MDPDRTFRDVNGIEWHVSHVSPETAAAPPDEDWLSFESGPLERRLTPVPANWRGATIGRLEQMCRIATPIQRDQTAIAGRSARVSGEQSVADTEAPDAVSEAPLADAPESHEHVSRLVDLWPARASRIAYRG